MRMSNASNSNMAGFEVIPHQPSQFMKEAATKSLAWNKHYTLSLLMGLAIHPSVQTVEVWRTVELASMDVVQGDRSLKADTPKNTERPMSEPDIIVHQTNSDDFSW